MERVAMVRIDFGSILDLPPGPRRASLARKAIACLANEKDTGFLAQCNDIHEDEEAVEALSHLTSIETNSIMVPPENEPADRCDGTKDAVSIMDFSRRLDAEDLLKARRLKKEIRRLIRLHEWEDAAYLAVSGLFDLHGNRRRGMVKLLARIAPHHVVAGLHYGKCLVRGDAVRQDLETGIDWLERVTADDDPCHSGYAHFLLGETLMLIPGMGYRALRNFEGAAYLGWEDASDYAGVMCLLGENGVPRDIARAVRNFKYGMSHGQLSCMSKYVVLVLRGDAPFDPNWRAIHQQALSQRENLALSIHDDLLAAYDVADGDETAFLEECRSRIASTIGMNVEQRSTELAYEESPAP